MTAQHAWSPCTATSAGDDARLLPASRRSFLRSLACLGLASVLPACPSDEERDQLDGDVSSSDQAELRKLVEEYVDGYYRFHPVRGPESGIHTHDHEGLDDLGEAAIAREAGMVRDFQKRLAKIPTGGLGKDLAVDHDVVASHLAARLDDLEIDRPFTRDPYVYADIIQIGLLWQMIFPYAGTTLDSRLQNVLRQLDDVPRLMADAIHHLKSVPTELLSYGRSSLGDTKTFIAGDVPREFAGARLPDGGDAAPVLADKVAAASAAIDRLLDHLERLADAPDPKPPFALGEARLAKRLQLKNGISLPGEDPFAAILARAQAAIEANRTAFEAVAREIDSSRQVRDVWAEIQTHHPRPGDVARTAREQVAELTRFLEKKELISVPKDEQVTVAPSPQFMLYWYATMWQTGPFEPSPSPPGVYYVSDPAGILATEKEQNQFLESMVTPELLTTSAHEVMPGHFLQGYALKKVKRALVDTGRLSWVAVNNIFSPFSLSEGWAHYTEQMVREEGFKQDASPRELQEYMMCQLSDSLLRLCRTFCGIQMHRGEMTVPEAARFFEDNAFVPRDLAATEAQRGTYEPDYILYAIGKMAILQLRDDYREAKLAEGKAFDLREFHEAFLAQGQYPLPVLRAKLLLGDDRGLIR